MRFLKLTYCIVFYSYQVTLLAQLAIPSEIQKELESLGLNSSYSHKNPNFADIFIDSIVFKEYGLNSQKREYSYNSERYQSVSYHHWNTSSDTWRAPNSKSDNVFDEAGRLLINQASHSDDNNGILIPSYKTEYEYDEQGRLLNRQSYQWNRDSSDWQLSGRGTSEYQNDLRTRLSSWDRIDGEWFEKSRTEHTYDPSGRPLERNSIRWDEETKEIKSWERRKMEYNEAGLVLIEEGFELDLSSEDFTPLYRKEFTYDDNNRILSMIHNKWDIREIWFVTYREMYQYEGSSRTETNEWLRADTAYAWDVVEQEFDEKGLELKRTTFQWQGDTIYFGSLREYSYDAVFRNNGGTSYVWDSEHQDWDPTWQTEITFDTNGNQHRAYSYKWDENLKAWDNYSLFETDFDSQNNFVRWASGSWDGSDWVYDLEETCYASAPGDRAILSLPEKASLVYPNPVKDRLFLKMKGTGPRNLVLIDVHGKKVFVSQTFSKDGIDVRTLEPGMYFYQLYDGEQFYSGRLLKN